jgi:hypothetical protein
VDGDTEHGAGEVEVTISEYDICMLSPIKPLLRTEGLNYSERVSKGSVTTEILACHLEPFDYAQDKLRERSRRFSW